MIRRPGCTQGRAMRVSITNIDDNLRRLARLASRYDTLMYRDAAMGEKRLLNEAKLRYDDHVAQCQECSL
jgi:hypothetical protein